MQIVLLRLEGPLMAFGGVAVDERLPVVRFPALSMICGLLGNALGYRRTEAHRLQQLQASISLASRVDRPGHLITDYQTAELDADDTMWRSTGRLAERAGGAKGEFTVQLYRQYWADAAVTSAVGLPPEFIPAVVSALQEPARPLFLGRAACPPSRPIFMGVVDASDPLAALEEADLADDAPSARCQAQWPASLGMAAASHAPYVPDLKNWANRIHLGSRQVCEGFINVQPKKGQVAP